MENNLLGTISQNKNFLPSTSNISQLKDKLVTNIFTTAFKIVKSNPDERWNWQYSTASNQGKTHAKQIETLLCNLLFYITVPRASQIKKYRRFFCTHNDKLQKLALVSYISPLIETIQKSHKRNSYRIVNSLLKEKKRQLKINR